MAAPWSRDYTSVFLEAGGRLSYLPSTAVEKIVWKSLDEARVTVYGWLPDACGLLKLQDGEGLRIHHLCGRVHRSECLPEDEIMRLSGCKVRRKWLLNPVILDPAANDWVTVYVSLDCKLEFTTLNRLLVWRLDSPEAEAV